MRLGWFISTFHFFTHFTYVLTILSQAGRHSQFLCEMVIPILVIPNQRRTHYTFLKSISEHRRLFTNLNSFSFT